MTTAVLNKKIKDVENKIPVASGLGKKVDYDAKILHIGKKCSTTSDYNKFAKNT